jgi:serine/threonine protein kinase
VQGVQSILPVGSIIQERYRIEELLGKGGFGAVYLVRDLRVRGNLFALKEIIDTDKKERARFRFECEVLKRLDHRALPRVYRTFEDVKNNRAYMLMDYIEGPDLEMLRQRQPEKRFPLEQVMRMMAPIVDAVAFLHRQEPPVIHRDIKPANIIIPQDGGEGVLVDFGIAKEYDQESTTTAIRRCSPGYGAPEQYAKGTNPRTDIYGLAATFYALLTGLVPADALYRMTQIGTRHADPLESVHELVPEIPRHVSDAIQRALAIQDKERFATAEEFWQALQIGQNEAIIPVPVKPLPETRADTFTPGARSGQGASGLPDQDTEPTRRMPSPRAPASPQRRNLVLLFVILALIVLLSGIIYGSGLFLSGTQTRQEAPASRPAQQTVTAKATTGSTPTTGAKSTTIPAANPTTATPKTGITPTTGTTPTTQPNTAPTPTPVPATYPSLLGYYDGTLTNQFLTPNLTTSMTLQRINQQGANIRGYFSVGKELNGNGNFQGQVTTNNKIRFIVEKYQNNLPLLFEGTINADKSMSGTYCSYDNGKCNLEAGGHGTWRVRPGVSGSS